MLGAIDDGNVQVTGYDVTDAPLTDDDKKQVKQSLALYEQACKPYPLDKIITELATLKALTISAGKDTDDMSFQYTIYAKKISCYPADIVLYVLRAWPDSHKFWPSWNELQIELDTQAKKRLSARDALRKLLDN